MSSIQERFISAPNVTSAWTKGVNSLLNCPKHEAFNLAVRIEDPTVEFPNQRKIIEEFLIKPTGKLEQDHIEMVAQTIFPNIRLYYTCPDPKDPDQRQKLYDDYMRDKMFIRAFNSNSRGTYFQRMIWWPSWDTSREKSINQLEKIIQKISSGKASRVVNEIAMEKPSNSRADSINFYNPNFDRKFIRQMSFPCLSFLSIKPESAEKPGGKIHMTALYRNHYFLSRAYGNYLGLGWLLKFIADATGKKVGELLCISSLAKLDSSVGIPIGKIKAMIRILQKDED
jgi:hypothetical protein